MKIKDHFLSKETFDIVPTDIKGILKTSPIPKNLDKYYESDEYISHHQDNNSLKEKVYKFFQSLNLNYKQRILEDEKKDSFTVLDYGCGAGEFLKKLEKKHKTYGFEPNPNARKAAISKTEHTVFINDLSELEDQSLDIITLWHVFEHIAEPRKILLDFYTKLKPGGLLIIAVPNHTSYDAKKYKDYWAAYDVPRHLYHYSKNGMVEFFKTEKWKLKKIRPLLLDAFYISILSEKYKKSPLFWLKGSIQGAISNVKAAKNNEFSSLIYIVEKN